MSHATKALNKKSDGYIVRRGDSPFGDWYPTKKQAEAAMKKELKGRTPAEELRQYKKKIGEK